MLRRRVLLLFLMLVVFALPAIGQNTDEWWFLSEKPTRYRHAREYREEFTKLNAQIPTLSPAEEQWVKTEIEDTIAEAGGKYTARALAAMNSREYQIRVAKAHVKEIVSALDTIIPLSENPNDRLETMRWTKVCVLFMDKEFWQAIDDLVQRKVIQEKINGVDKLYYENHVLWAQEILNGIVLRYLATNSLP